MCASPALGCFLLGFSGLAHKTSYFSSTPLIDFCKRMVDPGTDSQQVKAVCQATINVFAASCFLAAIYFYTLWCCRGCNTFNYIWRIHRTLRRTPPRSPATVPTKVHWQPTLCRAPNVPPSRSTPRVVAILLHSGYKTQDHPTDPERCN